MEQRKHWWNGRWGRLARRDVFLRVDADRWHVEQRAGGAEGVSRFYEYDSCDEADETVRALLDGPDTCASSRPARPAQASRPPADRPHAHRRLASRRAGNRASMKQQGTEQQGSVSRITTGMRVLDAGGTEVGTVDLVQRGDPNAVTVQAPTADPGSSLDELIESAATEEPDVPADLAARLLRSGYLKVSTGLAWTGAVYVLADQIATVADDEVRLTVTAADLPAEE